jgi:AAHS family 3-hydroxyphenylpropionic acid transporter
MSDSAPRTSPTTKELQTYRVIALCALVILLEGFDLQAAGVSIPKLAPVFHLLPAQLGLFLGSSAVGIFISSALGGILADKFGRRPVVVAGVAVFGLFSLSTLFANGLQGLIAARFMTGLGLGAAMPAVIALASDHSPVELKKRAVGFIYCAIPIGGILSGVVIQSGLFGKDWRSVYLVGGIAPVVVAPILLFLLPNTRVVSKVASGTRTASLNLLSGLFKGTGGLVTISLWIGTFGTLLVMYLLLGWMPSLLIGLGLGKSQAQYIQMLYNLGGSVGAATCGILLDRKHLYSIPAFAYAGLALFLALLGFVSHSFSSAIALAFGIGFTVMGAQAAIYAFAPLCYKPSVRTTGVGATVAAGRLGTIVGPIIAGSLLGVGKSAADVLLVLIPVTLVSGMFALFVVRLFSTHDLTADLPVQDAPRDLVKAAAAR